MKSGFIGAVVLALVLIIGLGALIGCTVRVPAGYVGIVYDMNGGVGDEVLSQGWKLIAPHEERHRLYDWS